MSQQPNFSERCARMYALANALATCSYELKRMSDDAREEAERMAAAKQRFVKRHAERKKAD